MGRSIEELRRTAYRFLHLLYIHHENGKYRVCSRLEPESVPKLVEYVSFHYKTSFIRMKDTGSNYIYLVNPQQFRRSRIEYLLKIDNELESRLREWFPILWDEGTDEEKNRYTSLLRSLEEITALRDPL
ncbi:MAG: hypothetical protein EHM32_08095 [Spirochaetales bacterium]|nr:MAG: hypothetical protein EHM32_08095 [Spirochaetales bacterium]